MSIVKNYFREIFSSLKRFSFRKFWTLNSQENTEEFPLV